MTPQLNPQPCDRNTFIPLGLCALVVLAGLVAYSNSFAGVFIFDDERVIVENETIRSLWPISSLMADSIRPISMLSLAANYFFGELDVFGYHLVNLAIHLLAGLTLFGLVRRTLNLVPRYSADRSTADYLAFAVALVWMVHPLGTESVTYIIQRSESLMGLFYFACLYCVLRGSQTVRSWPWYVAAAAACWLGMGTKQVMVTAPLVVLLYDRIFLAEGWKEVVRQRWAMYAAFVPALVWLGASTIHAAARTERVSAGFSIPGITSLDYLGTQGGVILHYLRLAFWPDRLCLDYGWPVAESALAIFLPGVVVAALVVICFVALRSHPRLGFLGLSFFLILAPTSSIMPINDLAFEHRMYLPLAPLVVLVVLGADALARRLMSDGQVRRALEGVALVIVVASLVLRTMTRNRDYHDPIAMWTDTVVTSPDNARARCSLGMALARQKRPDEAAVELEHALRINPDYVKANYNLGYLMDNQGNSTKAAQHYRDALRVDPTHAEAHNNLGNLLQQQEQVNEAIAHYEQAIRFKANYAEAYLNLGMVRGMQGKVSESIALLERALAIRPDFAEAHLNLGNVLLQQGNDAEAADHLNQAIRLQPKLAQPHGSLGDMFLRQGNPREAIARFREALRLDPDLLPAVHTLAWTLATYDDPALRNGEEAVHWAERLSQATGDKNPVALDTLSAAYAEAGRWDEAVATARQAVEQAKAAGQVPLHGQIESRLRLYQQQKPFRDQPPQ